MPVTIHRGVHWKLERQEPGRYELSDEDGWVATIMSEARPATLRLLTGGPDLADALKLLLASAERRLEEDRGEFAPQDPRLPLDAGVQLARTMLASIRRAA